MSPGVPPYRAPAPIPAAPTGPSRVLGILANVVMLVLLLGSFGGCMAFGCSSDHLSDGLGYGLAIVSFLLCVGCGVFGSVIFHRAMKVAQKDGTASTIGMVLTILWTIITAISSAIFWIGSTTPRMSGLHGRPLRIGRRELTPAVKPSAEWARGPRPNVEHLDLGTRALLRDLWLQDAKKEHASVPAFGQVAWQLVALGAPADLVRRAHESALQEIDHAQRCFALASTYAGEDLGVQEMPSLYAGMEALPRERAKAVEKVALDSLIDGALLEDISARLAELALEDVRDEAAREALVRIVADESEHAALAWDIVAFCLAHGDATLGAKLEAALGTFEPGALLDAELAQRVASADATKLAEHGRIDAARAPALFTARVACAKSRLASLLARSVETAA